MACQERLEQLGARVLSDAELLTLVLSPTAGTNSVRDAAVKLLEVLPLPQIAWASPGAPTRRACGATGRPQQRRPTIVRSPGVPGNATSRLGGHLRHVRRRHFVR